MERFDTPRGTRDFPPEQAAIRHDVEQRVCGVFRRFGYQPIQTPVFENFDLFAARSGEEIIDSMITFSVDAVRVALRPEMTSAVCRLAAGGKLAGEPFPYKLFYFGPCFRYCRPQAGRYREFHQMGVELLGADSPLADAEMIAVAVNSLQALEIDDYHLRLGAVGVFRQLLHDGPAPVDAETQDRVIHDIDRLTHICEKLEPLQSGMELPAEDAAFLGRERASIVREQESKGYAGDQLLAADYDPTDEKELAQLPAALEATILHAWEADEIVSREKGEKLLQLTKLRGRGDAFWNAAKKLVSGTAAEQELDRLSEVCSCLDAFGIDGYEAALGVVRNLDFYTGVVFEIDLPLHGARTQVCGGGRYDRLVEDFGGQPTPATGFAFGFDRLVDAHQKAVSGKRSTASADVAVFGVDASVTADCVKLAMGLRSAGLKVVSDLLERSAAEQEAYAKKLGVRRTIILSPESVARNVCRFISWDSGAPVEQVDALLDPQELAVRTRA
ncbi:histidine--tRNA ligase [Lignipirellula cremea]|uniref:histidine--tRNA ligase n=1 Tax=Lignipirellula cremea TaxID=2528010 RepID=UPI0011AA217E|nr:histidine--tRNA ligase [Lignipirellula cremea]